MNPADDPPPPTEAEAEAGDLPPGFMVGEYRIEGVIGRGGMGAVYAAVQPEIGARVAIKVLATALSRDPSLCLRFVEEARIVNRIRHPNIIDVFAFGRLADGRQYFVMEHLDGETLAARLERGPLPPSEARRLLQQICEALQAAHEEKVVHRDLKPENLWIAMPKYGQAYAKVLDFGIAKLLRQGDASAVTEVGTVMGTPHYMSPEQCRGETVDQRTDIYAMGVILYSMWSGRLPFDGSNFVAVATQQIASTPAPPSAHGRIPARLERLIMACLEKDPARRPASAKALGREIGEALVDALPGATIPAGGGATSAAAVSRGAATSFSPASADRTEQRIWGGDGEPRRYVSARVAAAGAAIALVAAAGAILLARARTNPSVPPPAASVEGEATTPPRSAATAVIAAPDAAERPRTADGTSAAPMRNGIVFAPDEATVPGGGDPGSPTAPARRPARVTSARAAAEHPAPAALEQRGFLKENPFR